MKKIIFVLYTLVCSMLVTAQGTFRISNGAHLKLTGGAYVVTENMNVENNGTVNMSAGDGILKFTGGANVNFSGTGTTVLSTLYMAKNMPAQVNLQKNITINNQLFFSIGNINLGNNVITLQGIGSINGESETGRVLGTGAGYVQATATLNAPSSQNPGNLGAIITSASNLGNTVVRRGHTSQNNSFGNANSILRYYDIIPANNSNLNAKLRFSYLDAELNGHNESSLTLWKSENNINWTNLGMDARDMAQNYIEQTAIEQMARFTLADVGGALPVGFDAINTACLSSGIRITWTTGYEQGTSAFIVQQSNNGRTWSDVGRVGANGSHTGSTYSYTIPGAGNAQFRIVEEGMNGRKTLSPVVVAECNRNVAFSVFPNPVTDYVAIRMDANTGQTVTVKIQDAAGKLMTVQSRKVIPGNNQFILSTSGWPSGTYIITVEEKDKTRSATIIK